MVFTRHKWKLFKFQLLLKIVDSCWNALHKMLINFGVNIKFCKMWIILLHAICWALGNLITEAEFETSYRFTYQLSVSKPQCGWEEKVLKGTAPQTKKWGSFVRSLKTSTYEGGGGWIHSDLKCLRNSKCLKTYVCGSRDIWELIEITLNIWTAWLLKFDCH